MSDSDYTFTPLQIAMPLMCTVIMKYLILCKDSIWLQCSPNIHVPGHIRNMNEFLIIYLFKKKQQQSTLLLDNIPKLYSTGSFGIW